jgi:putative Holliday junction resolvase
MILGVDPGERRIGLAVADLETRIATPLEVVDARADDAVARIADVVEQKGIARVVVGRPVGLSGRAGPAVAAQSAFVARLRERLRIEVTEFDERMTTVVARRAAPRPKGSRRRRAVDAVAAQLMLQGYLDSTRERA